MGAGDEGAVVGDPSTREAPEKGAIDASAPLEGALRVNTYYADVRAIAAWTRSRGLDDECGTRVREEHHGFLWSSHGEEPA